MALKGKMLIELDYEFLESTNAAIPSQIVLKHPDLKGTLWFVASSERLGEAQLESLEFNPLKPSNTPEDFDFVGTLSDLKKELLEAFRVTGGGSAIWK